MSWKRGTIKFDDGSTYPAEFLFNSDGEVWNIKVYKEGDVVEEVDAQNFATKLGKDMKDVYPFTYDVES
jgi:hypothetical protein